jgi:hypothetical protein
MAVDQVSLRAEVAFDYGGPNDVLGSGYVLTTLCSLLLQHSAELEAWLYDEKKVVTARWLSLVLNVPASASRRCVFVSTKAKYPLVCSILFPVIHAQLKGITAGAFPMYMQPQPCPLTSRSS